MDHFPWTFQSDTCDMRFFTPSRSLRDPGCVTVRLTPDLHSALSQSKGSVSVSQIPRLCITRGLRMCKKVIQIQFWRWACYILGIQSSLKSKQKYTKVIFWFWLTALGRSRCSCCSPGGRHHQTVFVQMRDFEEGAFSLPPHEIARGFEQLNQGCEIRPCRAASLRTSSFGTFQCLASVDGRGLPSPKNQLKTANVKLSKSLQKQTSISQVWLQILAGWRSSSLSGR